MKLFENVDIKGLSLTSRIVMAPLTRRRSTKLHVPVPIMEEYYAQRSSAGLIIAEGCSPSPNGAGYANMPGLYNREQKIAWSTVTDKVHAQGGKIFLQVMHTGRVGHSNNLDKGAEVIAPSAIRQEGEISTYDFEKQPYSLPREMTLYDIETTINEFNKCSEMAIEAGFDGVEIHSAHGYLPNQFINESSNIRKDKYGGSIENRLRFLLEVLNGSCDAIGSEKVSLRISPFSYADTNEKPEELFSLYKTLSNELNNYDLAYLHLSHMGEAVPDKFNLWKEIREIYNGNLMLCGDFNKKNAEKSLLSNEADLIAFGRDYIANPDLVERLKNNWPLAKRDNSNWYTLGSKGLTDFPFYDKLL